MWPSTSCPLSSLTRNIVLGRASVISPSISIFSSLAMRGGAYLTAQVLERSRPIRHFACILGGLQLGEGGPQLRPRLDAELGRDLVPAQQRLGRAVAAPVERSGDHLPRQPQVSGDHLGRGNRPLAPSGEA